MPDTKEKPRVLNLHAFLEPRGESAITRSWEQAGAMELDIGRSPIGVRPHMTLGSWQVQEITDGLAEKLASTLSVVPSLKIMLTMRLMARERAYFSLVPFVQRELLDFHEAVHKAVGSVGKPYRAADQPGTWNPHISLFNCAEEDLPTAYELIKCLPMPIKTEITCMGLVTYGGGGPVKTLITFPIDQ